MTDDARFDEPIEQGEAEGNLTRRKFGKLAAATAIGGVLPRWLGEGQAAESAFASAKNPKRLPRPNVLFIMADDLARGDLSAYGNPRIRTPNLDRLAASGVRFTDSYSTSAVCSPTRFGLYTGRFPGRLQGGLKEPLNAASEELGIPADHPTLATLLKKRGYDTAMIGKWHCGFLPWFGPRKSGWDEFYGNYGGGMDHFSKVDTRGEHDLYRGETPVRDNRYYTNILAEKASRYVSRKHGRPWLLNLNLTSPHWPWEGPKDRAVSKELTARIRAGENATITLYHLDGGSLDVYRSMVENLDRAVGKVMKALKRSGALDDTLVIFTSDNGGERFSYNWPFSGDKSDLREGGIRVPTIASWPGRIKPRQVSHVPIVTHDWTATLVELAGAKPDPSHPFDGASLVKYLFRGGKAPARDMFWRMNNERALRRGRFKYYRSAEGLEYLFDLKRDVREQANIRYREPARFESMRASWEKTNSTLLPYPT